ncbi:MAG: hypothetical protein ABSC01_04055 [Verrucomicrobiota bacterium]
MPALKKKNGQREKQRGGDVPRIKIQAGGRCKIIYQSRKNAEVDEQRMAQGANDDREQHKQPCTLIQSENAAILVNLKAVVFHQEVKQ